MPGSPKADRPWQMDDDHARPFSAYIGTYTRPESFVNGKGEGIYIYRVDRATGAMTYQATVGGLINPSFLALAPGLNRLYAVSEIGSQAGEHGLVSAFAIDPVSHGLTHLNTQPAHGLAPCHIAIGGREQCVLVANYATGTLCVLPILKDGRLGQATDVVQFEGSGPHPRQEGPHAHMVIPGPNAPFVYAVDLGADKILIYRLDPQRGKLTPADPPWTKLHPGAGPRHITFHPSGRFAYTVNELDSTVSVLHCDPNDGSLQLRQTITTLPDDFSGAYRGGDNLTAEIQIAPSGDILYASNRGHDSIVIYAVNRESGRLSTVAHESVQGVGPRHFLIDPTGSFLWVANQDSDTVLPFRIDPKSGKLLATGNIANIPTPVCIQIVNHHHR